PAAAVMSSQQGTYVFVVDADSARQQPVQVARTADSVVVIGSGLTGNERVILTGQSRLITGSKVTIKGAKK
ncbi:MAG TPA: hypothetical protein VFC35_07555, partial [Gemmatimonadaceae bacterium]|nr:hypothetical protein [Gemmatimonadaceae bacterium]